MLSQTAEYALRAMWYLARHSGEPQVMEGIAQGTEVSRDYLYKVLQQLVRGRLVRSKRGKGGGFVLAREPKSITLFDIVDAVGALERLTHCPLTNRASCVNHEAGQAGLCPLHATVDAAARQFERRLSAIRLTDLLQRIQTKPTAGRDRARLDNPRRRPAGFAARSGRARAASARPVRAR
jgi:Rrf2 family protein